jgi:uncharacterized membrane protein YeaQ/YmgE (transglycosylase-associated protein family)
MAVVTWLAIGAGIGLLIHHLAPGRYPGGLLGTLVGSMTGAFLGGGVYAALAGNGAGEVAIPSVLAAPVGALALLALVRSADQVQPPTH